MTPVYVGIDPGKDGAVVALDATGRCVAQLLTREVVVPGRGLTYRAEAMTAGLRHVLLWSHATSATVALERVSTRPGEGRTSALVTGAGWGLWRGIAACLAAETLDVAPRDWQRVALRGVPGRDPKARAVLRASSIPGLDLTPGRKRKPHQGLADAACIALYALHHIHHRG